MTAKSETLNIHQRILAVMKVCAYVQKNDKGAKGLQYNFVSHDAVTAKLHPLFVEHGICVVPTVAGRSRDGNMTEVDLNVAFINADDPKDRIDVAFFGYGIDQQDKGPGKAISYAYKYGLLKMFALETGDDPERDSIDHAPAEPVFGGPLGKQALKDKVREFDVALRECADLDAIDRLAEEYDAVLCQVERDMPSWWKGNGGDVDGLEARIQAHQRAVGEAPAPPTMIPVPVTPEGEPNWKGWAATMKTAITAAGSVDEVNAWMSANEAPMKNLATESAPAHAHLKDVAAKRLGYLSQE